MSYEDEYVLDDDEIYCDKCGRGNMEHIFCSTDELYALTRAGIVWHRCCGYKEDGDEEVWVDACQNEVEAVLGPIEDIEEAEDPCDEQFMKDISS